MTRLLALVLILMIAVSNAPIAVNAQTDADELAAAEMAVELSWYESVGVCASHTTTCLVDGVRNRSHGSLNLGASGLKGRGG